MNVICALVSLLAYQVTLTFLQHELAKFNKEPLLTYRDIAPDGGWQRCAGCIVLSYMNDDAILDVGVLPTANVIHIPCRFLDIFGCLLEATGNPVPPSPSQLSIHYWPMLSIRESIIYQRKSQDQANSAVILAYRHSKHACATKQPVIF